MATQTEYKKTDRRMLIVVISLSLLLLIVAALLPILFQKDAGPGGTPDFEFADPALSADPTQDSDYMDLDRAVYYRTLVGYEVTVPVPSEDADGFDSELLLLVRMIRAVMAGDLSTYRTCFSPEYLTEVGEIAPFTKQKLYDITVTHYHDADVNVPTGYTSVVCYGVAYKIKDNNGSFRNDLGSDAVREQVYFVVKDAAGSVAVYGIRG